MKRLNDTAVAKSVDEYIMRQPESVQEVLSNLRDAIKKAAPKSEELISYQIPTYKQDGALVHFAAFEDHCSFIVINKNIIKDLAKELKGFTTSGTTIHFTPDNPLPKTLVQKIVKIRLNENQERKLAKVKS